ncbi:MAG: sigma-70 family RNA polymerase sigma factor [Sphingobium sp.]|uniref:RNA polymerase sigma factor n=1 Tax=Sphingobium sp. JS3065 TaxID=2970925 RepID=UPI0022648045|nr:sigma-70 family RNA polymerase sigma factor [Sphingobium sp. JS3065]MCI1270690.1 sigma-70 family RNA polymerase sigma factor [Sphingobium sp.]MCI1754419.1 sigma-70 family RNA polymerase sigma factor [Sphingobium sp.]MCI2053351.1 sigma-70 family RNA polymerase sigma factor [Sphingobium sp.]UZW56743.1 sigma-70 family RNA polymerase sigma factor [Sphingobium sp. JS3065]
MHKYARGVGWSNAGRMSEGGLKGLFLDLRPALTRYLLVRGLSQDDADDLIQDMYLKLESYQGGPVGEPRAYLYRMTHNLLLDRRRSAARRIRREKEWSAGGTGVVSEVDVRPSAEEALIARERLNVITTALKILPERTRDIFRRFRIDGQTQKVIAGELGVSKSAVEKHLYRAYHVVAAAKARLDEEPGDATIGEGERHRDMSDDHDR